MNKEFLNYINEDEIGLFVMSVNGKEDIINTEKLVDMVKDIKVFCIDRIKGVVLGSIFGSDVEISLV